MKKAVILLSGGMDSSTAMSIAKEEGYELHALTLVYGQRHEREIDSARMVAGSLEAEDHEVFKLPEGLFSASALTGDSEIPMDRDPEDMTDIPATYVPARNLVFLSIAVSRAEAIDADAVFTGITAVDYSGYPDCRPDFIEAFRKAQELATGRGVSGRPVEIRTPLIEMSKSEIILAGIRSGLDYGLTWSCYKGGEKACGRCDTCTHRLKGFRDAGLEDPLEYEVR